MQLKQFYLFFLLLLAACNVPTPSEEMAEGDSSDIFAFVDVNVLPMTGNSLSTGQTVIVKDGKIEAIGPAADIDVPAGATVLEASGKYLMPGLAEMHAHIPVPQEGNDALVRETLFLYLSRGVTTIRGMLGNPYHLELKKMIEQDSILSPRVFTSSPSLNGNTVPNAEEARRLVTQYQRDGYDFLKIHPGIPLEAFDEMAKTAREVGITFSGHVPQPVGIRHALDAQYASIDHLDGYLSGLASQEDWERLDNNIGFFGYRTVPYADANEIAVLAQQTKDNGVWIVPTQSLFTRWFSPVDPAAMANEPEMKYMSGRTRYQWRQSKQNAIGDAEYNEEQWKKMIDLRQQLLRALHEADVPLLLGSDAPQVFNVPGFSLEHEMNAMADAGISNAVILHSGTSNPARFFGQEGAFGTIQKGASADLLLLSGNPLEDLSQTWAQEGVMVRGYWMPKDMIDEQLREIAAAHAE
ncbi:amidohydrolase family protein [Flavilitoribacter nigricans]|nr:amidohydrolase family protein [Flavilitoribacter nigricans]